MAWSDYVVEGKAATIECNPVAEGNIYRHFKGGYYRVIGLAKNSADSNELFVIYRSIDPLLFNTVWARDYDEFCSKVDASKYPEFAGQNRFEYIGRVV